MKWMIAPLTMLLAGAGPICASAQEPASPPAEEVARQVFLSAAESHRAVRESQLAFSTRVEYRRSLTMPFDGTTTGTVERLWRFECRGDYKLGALVSETCRVSEKFNGVEQIDFPRPVLAHRLSADTEPRAIRQAVPRRDPNWSTLESNFVDDSKLVDAIDMMDRAAGQPTAEFLDWWREAYIDAPALRPEVPITVTHAHDGTSVEVTFDCLPPRDVRYVLLFERDQLGYRFTSMRCHPGPLSGYPGPQEIEMDWVVVGAPGGAVVRLPVRSIFRSEEELGPSVMDLRAPEWTVSAPAADTREFEALIAERSALIMYEGMQHRLEVERRRREEGSAPAPSP